MRRGLVWMLTVALCLAACGTAAGLLLVVRPILYGDAAGPDPVRVEIPNGASLAEIASRLSRVGVVQYPFVFRRYAAMAQFDRQVRAGEYEFVAGESYRRILERLRQGDILQIKVTIPEGLTAREIAALLQVKLGIHRDEFMRVAEDRELLLRHGVDSPSFDGYLFPDTYFFPTRISAQEVLEMMLQRFFVAWTPAHEERARGIGLTRGQVLTLASIVEGEALLDSERPRISAVYHNRLRRDMLLQADPTVLYALGGMHRRVLYRDLLVASPYNTYVNRGLPPGPICNPGLRSIEAALAPLAGVDELFFVAARDGTGRHVFSRTFDEHEAARRRAERIGAARMAQSSRAAAASEDLEPSDENAKDVKDAQEDSAPRQPSRDRGDDRDHD